MHRYALKSDARLKMGEERVNLERVRDRVSNMRLMGQWREEGKTFCT